MERSLFINGCGWDLTRSAGTNRWPGLPGLGLGSLGRRGRPPEALGPRGAGERVRAGMSIFSRRLPGQNSPEMLRVLAITSAYASDPAGPRARSAVPGRGPWRFFSAFCRRIRVWPWVISWSRVQPDHSRGARCRADPGPGWPPRAPARLASSPSPPGGLDRGPSRACDDAGFGEVRRLGGAGCAASARGVPPRPVSAAVKWPFSGPGPEMCGRPRSLPSSWAGLGPPSGSWGRRGAARAVGVRRAFPGPSGCRCVSVSSSPPATARSHPPAHLARAAGRSPGGQHMDRPGPPARAGKPAGGPLPQRPINRSGPFARAPSLCPSVNGFVVGQLVLMSPARSSVQGDGAGLVAGPGPVRSPCAR